MRRRCILVLPALFGSLLLTSMHSRGQSAVHITFDGPPAQPPGSAYTVQRYDEAGVSFTPISSFGFGRVAINPVPGLPDNGSAYLNALLGDNIRFRFTNGAAFDLLSVDLSEYSTVVPDAAMVRFVGYRCDGSNVIQDFTTDGIIDGTGPAVDFQTFHFGQEFSGLTRVEIPTFGWSLDNLVLEVASEPRIVTIHSPSHGSFFAPGAPVALSASVSNAATNLPLRAQFFIDGQSAGVDDSSPYEVNWKATPGAHVLRVTALASNGYSTSSASRLFFVADPLLPLGSTWNYKSGTLSDALFWSTGNGQFGFGDGDETTVLSWSNLTTHYFLNRLTNDLAGFNYAGLQLLRDDGAVVYLNGQELGRFNLPPPPEPILSSTLALTNVGVPSGHPFPANELGEPAVDLLPVPVSAFVSGTNVLLVEVHQSSLLWPPSRFDLSFDLALFAYAYNPGSVLSIEARRDRAILRWPDYLEDWALEQSTDLVNWAPVTAFRGTVNGSFRVTVEIQAHQFFRLRQASGP